MNILLTLLSKLNIKRLAVIGLVVLVGWIIHGYQSSLVETGVQQCQLDYERGRSDQLIQQNFAIEKAVKSRERDWQDFHDAELARLAKLQESQIVYVELIKEVPTIVENSSCKLIGVDALRLYNDTLRNANKARDGPNDQ